jgi:subtilisin family serine protease
LDIIHGLNWINTKKIANPRVPAVVSMSFGLFFDNLNQDEKDLYYETLKSLYDSGITLVATAMNYNCNACLVYPGASPYTINVGATDFEDQKAGLSNYGRYGSCFHYRA